MSQHDLRHATDHHVCFEQLGEPRRECSRDGRDVAFADEPSKCGLSCVGEEFSECQRVQREHVDLANGERHIFVAGYAHVGAGGNDVVVRRVFAEILERSDCARAFLDFIEEYKRAFRADGHAGVDFDGTEQCVRGEIAVEECAGVDVAHEVDARNVVEV